jgi:hypothetical protein
VPFAHPPEAGNLARRGTLLRVQDQSALVGPPITSMAELPARLAAIVASLPDTDGVAAFSRMYQRVTDAVQDHVGAGTFADPVWLSALDVTFGNLYLDALRASVQNPDAVPRAWAALLEARADPRVTPLQLALAGMNAHINRDLPVALVAVSEQLGTPRDTGAQRADFERVNGILAQVEPAIRQSLSDALLSAADRALPGLQDAVANFKVVNARETAWRNGETLWALRRVAPTLERDFLDGLDHLVGFAGRGLLVPLRPVVAPARANLGAA